MIENSRGPGSTTLSWWPKEARYPSHSALQVARPADRCDPRGGFFLGGEPGEWVLGSTMHHETIQLDDSMVIQHD